MAFYLKEGIILVDVAIVCLTYNHMDYIEATLNSFMDQETAYSFSVVIHDDCSTDGTSGMLLKYKEKYPESIKLMQRSSNQYSKVGFNFFEDVINFQEARYYMYCEGDDQWLQKDKLQQSVDYMDKHGECSMLFTPAIQKAKNKLDKVRGEFSKRSKFNFDFVLDNGGGFYPTCTSIFRQDVFKDKPRWFYKHSTLDFPFALNSALCGEIHYIDSPTAVYNSHDSSVSHYVETDLNNYRKRVERKFESHCEFFNLIYSESLIRKGKLNKLISKEIYVKNVKLYDVGLLSFFDAISNIDKFRWKLRFCMKKLSLVFCDIRK